MSALDHALVYAVSFVGSKFDNRPQAAVVTWEQLCTKLATPRRTACTVETCAKGEHLEIDKDGNPRGCRHKNGPGWQPVTFEAGRKKSTARNLSLLVVDADHLSDSAALEGVLARLERYRYVAHATHSDRAGDRCARIVIPLSSPVPAGDWPVFWPIAMRQLRMPADPSCCDASRLYYLPARPSDADYWYRRNDGVAVDVGAIVETARRTTNGKPQSIASALDLGTEGVVVPGRRHAMLKSLAGAMRFRGATQVEIEDALLKANAVRCNPPKPESEVRDLAAWAAAQPVSTRPAVDEIRARRERQQTPATEPGHPGYGDGGGFRMTELGNARRFVDAVGERFRFAHGREQWLEWDGKRWRPDTTGATRRTARCVPQAIYADVAALAARQQVAVGAGVSAQESAPVAELARWGRSSSKRSAIEAMLLLARDEPEIATSSDQLNREPWLFNVANGTIDLRSGDLHPHRQGDMITMLAEVDYDPAATCPLWERFLERVQPDPEVRAWLQRYLGYALTGDVREQCLAFCFGAGSNGKSVLLDVVLAIIGDYGLRAAPDLLVSQPHGERHPAELVALEGKRLAVCSEIDQGRQWAESTIKRITGDSTITARGMRENFRTFPATHKLVVAANTRPSVRGTDDGIWRRMRLVPWDVRIPDNEQDRELVARLIATEASGILAWLVRGCLAWQHTGLGSAAAIATATEQYRSDQDTLGRWIEDRCELRCDTWQATACLYTNYTAWCELDGIEPWSRKIWRERMLERRGIRETKRERGTLRVLTGIELRRAQ